MTKKFVPMYVDIVFKKIWGDPDNTNRLSFLLSKVLNIPYEDLKGNVEIIESEKKLKNIKEKRQRNDIVARITFPKKIKVNLEMNNNGINQPLIDRNVSYIVHIFSGGIKNKQDYSDIIPAIQINFNRFSINPDKIINKFYLRDDIGYKLTDKLQIYTIDIEKCREICYTESVKKYTKEEQEIIKIGALMTFENRYEFEKNISKIEMEEKMKKDIKETMEDLSEDEEILDYFDYEQDALALKNGEISEAKENAFKNGKIEGKKEGIIETAKKMKQEKFDLNTISRITGFSLEELENLN
ncbi:MAG: Rpn family recombination-promoting nuclease/putative transposase [Clostridium sp.]|nr:Rpn family recombination-promoting nuclease/putative transposase [Clostridium sp.]MCM1444539.1 Rpn family recombination-promoting nuclease/putative transposase [Candidatus Amulumruptor caecigallinarius]